MRSARAHGRLVREVLRLDDEGITLPVPPRIAHVLLDVAFQVRAVIELDDPGIVDHLVGDRDFVRALRNPDAIAVYRR